MGSIYQMRQENESPPPSPNTRYQKRKKVIEIKISDVGSRMKIRRINLGMTQVEVATKSGISSRYYGTIENGKNSPSLEKLAAISEVLGVSIHYLLNDRMDDVENRVLVEKQRIEKLFPNVPKDKINLVDGLITQAARLRVLLDDNWKDIIENGEYEKFRQSENQMAYDRKRPIVENYDNRDRTYQAIIKQLTDLLPQSQPKDNRNKLLGRK